MKKERGNITILIGAIVLVIILLLLVGWYYSNQKEKPNIVVNQVTTSTPFPSLSTNTATLSTKIQTTPKPTPTPEPILPMSFNGAAYINANSPLPPNDTLVEALIGDVVCGSTKTKEMSDPLLNFSIEIKSATQKTGCGKGGEVMTYRINGEKAQQTSFFNPGPYGRNVILNVSY